MPASRSAGPPSRRAAALQRPLAERLAAWLVTGPLGHLYSALADIAAAWAAYGRRRAAAALGRRAGRR